MFTQRAALLGFVAFCFYLIAVVNSLSGFFYALTWLSMALLGASLGVALLSLVGLECRLEITRSRGAAALGEMLGSGALVALSMLNGGTLNKTNVVIEVRVVDAAKQPQVLRFLLEALPSGAALDTTLPLWRLRRGRYQLEEVRLIGSDVLGLFRMQKVVELGALGGREIVIGPPILSDEGTLSGGARGILAGHQRALSSRQGDELRGTRPYAPGDDLRHVHWKSSARAGELVVKEWEQTGQGGALVIWDGAAETVWGAGDWDSGEWGLILSASLCQAFLAGGTPCELARLDENPLAVGARALVAGALPPAFTDALSGAGAGRAIGIESGLRALPGVASRGLSRVIVVSASLGAELGRGASALRGRGASVEIVLIDAASLAIRSGDRRFRGRGPKASGPKASGPRTPTQSNGGHPVAVSKRSFDEQVARLRGAGFRIVSVAARDGEGAETSLRAAVRGLTRGGAGLV